MMSAVSPSTYKLKENVSSNAASIIGFSCHFLPGMKN